MKYLKKFNESQTDQEIIEDVEDALIHIIEDGYEKEFKMWNSVLFTKYHLLLYPSNSIYKNDNLKLSKTNKDIDILQVRLVGEENDDLILSNINAINSRTPDFITIYEISKVEPSEVDSNCKYVFYFYYDSKKNHQS